MMLFTLGGFFKSIISLFKTRVLSVGSNFEAETNLENQLNTLGSNLFDSASLIITPNAYKENLLFAVKPDKVGTNLLLQTAAFTTPWIISNQLDIENYLQPFGNSPAKKFTVKSTYTTGNVAIQHTAITANLGDYTFSIFVKNINAKWILFQIDNNMSVLGYWVNIEDYTLGSIRNSNNSTFDVFSLNNFDIIDYPDGWKRIVLGFKNVSSATIKPTLFITNTNGTLNPSTSGDSVILFAPQLVTGPTVTDYISTTDRAIVNGTIGDLTVTRATTATRVNEQGLIEPVPYNLITYSEEFENSQWTKSDITIAQNSIISPNGDMTGDKLIEGTNNGLKYIISYILGSIGSIHTASVYLKANTRTWAYLTFGWDSPGDKAAYFNLIDGVVGNLEGGVTASIMSIGNGWYRCTITGTMLNNTPRLGVAPATGNGIRSYLGDGISSIYAWGAQLVNGTEPKPYQPTTNRLNVPRIDYSTGQPAILVEPQRTNLVFPSDIATTQVRAVTAQVYTLSFYGNGTVALSGAFSGSLIGTGTNNRVSLTFTPTAGNLTLTVDGSVTNWQLEAGSNATSLIKTISGSVTRNADVIYKDGIIDLIGQTDGSIYVETILQKEENFNGRILIALTFNTNVNIFGIGFKDNRIVYIIRNNNGSILTTNASNNIFSNGTLMKICCIYSSSNLKLFVNGVLLTSGTLTNFPNIFNGYTLTGDRLFFGGNLSPRKLIGLYTYALTDQQAITLTTL